MPEPTSTVICSRFGPLIVDRKSTEPSATVSRAKSRATKLPGPPVPPSQDGATICAENLCFGNGLAGAGYKIMVGIGAAQTRTRTRTRTEVQLIEQMIDNRMDGLILVVAQIAGPTLEQFAR